MHLSLKSCRSKQDLLCTSIVRLILLVFISFHPLYCQQWFAEGAASATIFSPGTQPFDGAVAFNAMVGAGARTEINKVFSVGGLIGYSWMPGRMLYDERVTLSIEDDPVEATVRHDKNVELGVVYLEPFGSITLAQWNINVGARVGYVIDGGTEVTQRVIDPPGVSFQDGDVITDFIGPYPGLASLAAWATIGFFTSGNRIGSLRFDPGITFVIPITSMSNIDPFRTWSAGLNMRVVIDPLPILPIRVDTTVITDTAVVESFTESEPTEIIDVIRVDSLEERSETEIYKHVTVNKRLTRTIGIGVPLLLTEARAQFINSDGTLSDRTSLRVTLDKHELRVDVPNWQLNEANQVDVELSASKITNIVDAAITSLTKLRAMQMKGIANATTVVHWTIEHWDSCKVRYAMHAGGDAEPTSWKLTVRDPMHRIVDSIGGVGEPPPFVDRVLPISVLEILRSGGELAYTFAALGDDGRWTAPVQGLLVFEAMQENPGRTYRWKLMLPETAEQQTTERDQTWTQEQRAMILHRRSAYTQILLNSSVREAP